MKSLNAKRIAAIVTGAALLGAGLAFAGPLTFQNVPIISNSGQPVVQVVIGSSAKPSDGVAAGNIAAAIGNLAYTSTPVGVVVNQTKAKSLLSVSVSSAKYSLSNQQVWLNESGVTTATGGTYLFSALIGSVLNQGIQLGSLSNTKALQPSGSYTFPESFFTTNSPVASPYTAAGSVPIYTSVTSSNGGGVTFSSFTSSSNDNLLQIQNAQFSSLSSNYGTNGETSSLFLTGFPVYDQASGVNNFALLDVGGAWVATFSKPIANRTNSNSLNINVPIKLLGQNYTIINATGLGTNQLGGSTSKYIAGGKLYLASTIAPLQTIYVGHNITSGPWSVQLQDLAETTSGTNTPAAVAVYYNGVQTNETTIAPGTTQKINVTGHTLFVNINTTFAGLYAYQKWAKIQLYTNVWKLTNSQQLNATSDPGWNVNLLWTNNTGTGLTDQLYGIVIYNVTPTTLLPGQSFTFIQNPAAYKVTFIGDTLGSGSYDPVSLSTSTVSGLQYAASSSGTVSGGSGTISVTNITEPGQVLTVTSSIGGAFSYGGQTSATLTYDLTPYGLGALSNSLTQFGSVTSGTATNVIFTYNDPSTAANSNTPWISAAQPVGVTIIGYSQASKTKTSQSVSFVYNGTGITALGTATPGNVVSNSIALNTPLYNVTAIQIQGNRALPIYNLGSLLITVQSAATANAANVVTEAILSSNSPVLLYTVSGQNYLSTTAGAATSVNYNQQNGQPIGNALLTTTATTPSVSKVAHQVFSFKLGEVSVPSNTQALDYLGVGLFNATVGTSPNYILNYSSTGTAKNVTYTSTQGTSINAQAGFRTEKGSKVGSISPSSDVFQMATAQDQLQFALSNTGSNSVVTKSLHTFGPYSVGQATNLPNVSIAAVNASVKLSNGASNYTITGLGNLTSAISTTPATAVSPVWLRNLSSTAPLVVLDSAANSGSNLILVGSGYVNSLSQTLQSSYNVQVSPSSAPIVQAYGGNRILVAGYYANQTTSAANSFISQLYAAAAVSHP